MEADHLGTLRGLLYDWQTDPNKDIEYTFNTHAAWITKCTNACKENGFGEDVLRGMSGYLTWRESDYNLLFPLIQQLESWYTLYVETDIHDWQFVPKNTTLEEVCWRFQVSSVSIRGEHLVDFWTTPEYVSKYGKISVRIRNNNDCTYCNIYSQESIEHLRNVWSTP